MKNIQTFFFKQELDDDTMMNNDEINMQLPQEQVELIEIVR